MVKKIAPSVVWFDDIFVTASGPDGVGVIAGWQLGKNACLVVFSSKNSRLRNSHGRKQLSFLQALLQRGLRDR
ncbi:hypothetical protein [Polaromonas glacialis]|uniref:hypothetical protein n=1 Tax=Polaromonas glacialis TaxID=866564 RepID=UPI0012EC1663|nr:hypothetical protein [Polaromonas glacialis]